MDGSSSSSGAEYEIFEIEGPLEYLHPLTGVINDRTYLRSCDGRWDGCLTGNVRDVWLCSGAYARLRGYVEPYFSGLTDGPCGDRIFHVLEVVESRSCQVSDCDCAGELICESQCWGADDCLAGEKCAPWTIPGALEPSWACAGVPDDAAKVGEPCSEDPARPWADDCDADSTCVDGACWRLCESDADCGPQHCVQGLCFESCNPLGPTCGAEQECRHRANEFVCVDEGASPERGPRGCFGTTCDHLHVCSGDAGCGDDCCEALCDLTEPSCPAGLECTDPGFQEVSGVGVCRVPSE